MSLRTQLQKIDHIIDKKLDHIILGKNSILPILCKEALKSTKGYTSNAQTFLSLIKVQTKKQPTIKRVETQKNIVLLSPYTEADSECVFEWDFDDDNAYNMV